MRDATRWTPWALAVLGAWLATMPFSAGYASSAQAWSDHASGVALLALGLALAWRDIAWLRWGACLVGLWLLLAPLVLSAPNAAAYTVDNVAGVVAVALSVVIPPLAGQRAPDEGPERPRGWGYNPSSWSQRLPPVLLAVLGFFAARHLAAEQLGHIGAAWEPFFGAGTQRVLHSSISQAWPVPDAGLGAIGYLLDALAGLAGGTRRWRTAPWIVVLFGIFVVPLGAVSITLVVLQPVAVGAWCTLCLFSALISLAMIPLAVDEVFASLQYLAEARRRGLPFWRTLFQGGDAFGASEEPRRGQGLTYPWGLVATLAAGLALMAAPSLFGYGGRAADSDHLAGPLLIAFSVVAFAEIARPIRFLNPLVGLWVAFSPWILDGMPPAARWAHLVVGLAILPLSLPRGRVTGRYGRWQRYVV